MTEPLPAIGDLLVPTVRWERVEPARRPVVDVELPAVEEPAAYRLLGVTVPDPTEPLPGPEELIDKAARALDVLAEHTFSGTTDPQLAGCDGDEEPCTCGILHMNHHRNPSSPATL